MKTLSQPRGGVWKLKGLDVLLGLLLLAPTALPGVEQWGQFEITLHGPAAGNPYLEVKLEAVFTHAESNRRVTVPGFWDGRDVYKIRFSPPLKGRWYYVTRSNAAQLDGHAGECIATEPTGENHGPVRVFRTLYFRFADGTPYHQFGTTCYAWVHQPEALQEQTLKTLAASPFNKIRFCVFPKHYVYNHNEPERFPFVRRADGGSDFDRPDPAFWRHFEQRVLDLQRLGIQADIILWHPYDRWGFKTMDDAQDDRYLRYCIARLSAFRNVWWSLANEFDFMSNLGGSNRGNKTMEDWDRFFSILQREDPHQRLRGIHNGAIWYDHTKPWVTHASLQSSDMRGGIRYRRKYQKPVIYDECKYEGNIPHGWGNLTPQQMTQRFWLGTLSGCYVGHGETYFHPQDILWWSKGGVLHGQSPPRIAWLKALMAKAPPFHELAPLGNDQGRFVLGQPGRYYLVYCFAGATETLDLPGDRPYKVDAIDPWAMTIRSVGTARPGRFGMGAPDHDLVYRFVPYAPGEKLRPEARIQASPQEGTAPLSVRFQAEGGGEVYWDFGDGAASTERTVRHTFRQAGCYTVRLTVRDPERGTSEAYCPIRVDHDLSKPLVRAGVSDEETPPMKRHGTAKRGAEGSLMFPAGAPWGRVEAEAEEASNLAGLKSFTVVGWLRPDSLETGSGGNRILFCLQENRNGIDLVCLADGRLRLAINQWPDRVKNDSSPGRLVVGRWTFFAVSYDATKDRENVAWYFSEPMTRPGPGPVDLDRRTTYRAGPVADHVGPLAIGNFNRTMAGYGWDRQFRGSIRALQVFGSRVSARGAFSLERIRRIAAGVEAPAVSHISAGAATSQAPSAEWVWFEAEESEGGESNPELSGGRMVWVGPGGSISRRIQVPQAGRYTLWIRKFWNPQAIRWRVGPSPWQLWRGNSLVDLTMLNNDPSRRIGWLAAGEAEVPAGTQVFRLEVLPDEGQTTAYDCFLLTQTAFSPRGRLKPGESSGVSEPGWFAFEPPPDPFKASPIDLRWLNEEEAGQEGFIRVRDGRFVHGRTGAPVRFWAVNVGMGFAQQNDRELERFARAMAKRGVNMVRIHGRVYEGRGADFGRVKPEVVARLHRLVAALKREGIYTALSIYFPLWVRLGPENPDFPGYRNQHPFALPYFNEAFQPYYRRWWRAVLEPVNPHTGLALKDDPAVAMLEMINEDSTLFWTFNPDRGARGNIPDPQRALLERRFAQWLLARYPGETLEQIRQRHWQGLRTRQDDFAAGRVGFRPLWQIVQQRRARDQDTVRFLTELMLDWYRQVRRFLKEELGCRALVYCSNWKTASPQYLDPLDKYANAVGDFFDRHGYYGGRHEGDRASWDIVAGQRYDDRAAVKFLAPQGDKPDFSNPLWDISYNGCPSTITEVNWPLPNRFRADMVPLGAAYGALQDTDAIFWFAASAPEWQEVPGKFAIQTPVVLGQFPAAALLYRRGLVRTGEPVVDLELPVADLFALKGSPVPTAHNFDQLRGADIPPGATLTNLSVVDELAFLVGRVNVDFLDEGQPHSQVRDLSPYIDRANRRVQSLTGELRWDWGRGLVSIDAPAAQGAVGFLHTAPVELSNLRIEMPVEYGAVLLVALDGQPLAASDRMLLQVLTEEKPWRWRTDREEGLRTILDRGRAPLLVRQIEGRVTLKRADAVDLSVSRLDWLGYRTGEAWTGAAEIVLRPDTLYYLIERGSR